MGRWMIGLAVVFILTTVEVGVAVALPGTSMLTKALKSQRLSQRNTELNTGSRPHIITLP